MPLVNYCGFWPPVIALRPILAAQKHFKAKDSDIILSTMPKSGTTWLKALMFSIVNRNAIPIDQSPLLTSTPHMLVPALDFGVYWDQENPDLENILKTIGSVCLHPFHLSNEVGKGTDPVAIDEAFDMYCQGISAYGPFWDDILGYWNAHLENPGKSVVSQVRGSERGYPVSGDINGIAKNSSFFGKGQVGDWTNYLTPAMADRMKKLMDTKFEGSGLMFKT
ncbi:UNVERIFIED_CONTAM: Cytosolic sulfotransferase 5 [Sesamum radiatum]|uniref:Sulfotransferase n=1 Tax=Sesamum radiatum TaxID=300843 RepID=A0AAW2J8Y2_SESRA